MPQCHHQAVLQRVADSLHVAVGDLPVQWTSITAQATKDAAADLTTILALKGYSGAQIHSADQFAVWQERLAAYFSLARGSALASYDLKAVEWLDPRKMLQEASAILINGEPVAPGGEVIGGLAHGTLSAIETEGCRYDRRYGY